MTINRLGLDQPGSRIFTRSIIKVHDISTIIVFSPCCPNYEEASIVFSMSQSKENFLRYKLHRPLGRYGIQCVRGSTIVLYCLV